MGTLHDSKEIKNSKNMGAQEKFNKAWECKKQRKFKKALDLYRELQNEFIDEARKYAGTLPETRVDTDDGKGVKIMPKLFLETDNYLKRNSA
jgi:hypothetical protein